MKNVPVTLYVQKIVYTILAPQGKQDEIRHTTLIKIRGSVVSLSFIFPHPPEERKRRKKKNGRTKRKREEGTQRGRKNGRGAHGWGNIMSPCRLSPLSCFTTIQHEHRLLLAGLWEFII